MVTVSQVNSSHMMSDMVGDINTSDAEGDICAKGSIL
jgi:hypothetical protein